MARVNIDGSGVGKWAPSVFVIEIESGASGFSPTAAFSINPNGALLEVKRSQREFPREQFRISEYVRIDEIDNAEGILRQRHAAPHGSIHPSTIEYRFKEPTAANGNWSADIMVVAYDYPDDKDMTRIVDACRAFVAGRGEIWA